MTADEFIKTKPQKSKYFLDGFRTIISESCKGSDLSEKLLEFYWNQLIAQERQHGQRDKKND